MPYFFRFTVLAEKDINKLDEVVKERIKKKILHFEKLSNSDIGGYRLRVGDYRIIFDIIDNKIILVTAVKHRRNVYD